MDEPCLRPDGPDPFHQSPQEKTPSPPNPVPPAMGVTETIVQQLEEDRSTSPDSPMDRESGLERLHHETIAEASAATDRPSC
jgi:hypothetical protein